MTWMVKPDRLAGALLLCAALCLAFPLRGEESPEGKTFDEEHAAKMAAGAKLFREQVRTVLITRCLDCHGGEETEAEFDLSTRDALLRGGAEGKAIEIGNARASRLVKLIRHEVAPEMPLDEGKLDNSEIAAIVKWIDLGAPYDKPLSAQGAEDVPWTQQQIDPAAKQYWAFQPLKPIDPPATDRDTWVRSPIDQFILARLKAEEIRPNPAANPRVLVRRIYYDLIGLPPTPEEVRAFVNDCDTQASTDASGGVPKAAVEKLVKELLASPHYGQRWARHWLDVARFAESHGFEQDYNRPHAYHYRDFVIKAFNQDMPYDQFVRWQIAGDEIAPDNPLAMMATGFLSAGVFPTQLTEKEFESARYDELDDMVGTLGTAMLGLTIGCARCHDHKFDPIPQADYYRMVSTFTTAIRSEIELDVSTEGERLAAQRESDARLTAAVANLRRFEEKQLSSKFDKFLADFDPAEIHADPWTVLDLSVLSSKNGTKFKKQADGSLLVVGNPPPKDSYVLTANAPDQKITAVRVEALTHASLPRNGPGLAGNGNFCLTNFEVLGKGGSNSGQAVSIEIGDVRVTHQQNQGNLSAKSSYDSDETNTGWAVDAGGVGQDQAAVFIFAKPISFNQEADRKSGNGSDRPQWDFRLRFDHPNTKHAIGRLRLSVTAADPQRVALRADDAAIPDAIVAVLTSLANKKPVNAADRTLAMKWFASTLPEHQKLQAAVADLRAAGPPSGKLTRVMVCSEGVPKMKHHADGRGFPHFYPKTYFLKRGDPNQKQGEAPQGFLQALMRRDSPSHDPVELSKTWQIEPPEGSRTSYRRRSLSNWITDTDNGAGDLLARVIVNRVWHLHFGRGLVPGPNDFGSQSERPSHPELLDWLAADFIAHGWKLKRLHQQIIASAVYLQSSDYYEAKAKIDPDNELLWRYTPRRLEAEAIRDAMLAASGQLAEEMYGPGTLDEGMRRRSIYFMVKRSKLIPMMQLFDQPEPLVSQGRRPATTIAPQALLFMNNDHVREYARALARRLRPRPEVSVEETVRQGYWLALSRPPTDAELRDNSAFLKSQTESYMREGKSNAREFATTDFCQVLFSLNEFVFVE